MAESLPCAVLQLQPNGAIISADDEFARLLGASEAPGADRLLSEFLTAGSRVLWESQVLPAFSVRDRIDEVFLRLRAATGEVPVLINTAINRRGAEPRITVVMVRMERREFLESELHEARKRATELAERLHARTEELEAAKRHLEESIAETAASHWMLEKVADVLPICMDCGKVRTGRQWDSVLDFLKRNARFLSHGYCPECAARFLEREGLAD